MAEETENQPVAPLHNESLEQYLLHGKRQIRQLLQSLIDGHALISAHLSPGSQSFLTALVTLSDDEEWVFLDVSPDPLINAKALQAERMVCVTQLDRIRIQFTLGALTEMPLGGRPAFAARVPEQMARLQRRELYRMQVPLTHEVSCRLVLPGTETDAEPFEARVLDISPGGMAVQLPPDTAPLPIGTIIGNCVLKLVDGEALTVRLEVRNNAQQSSRSGVLTQRVGCRFVELPRAADTQIQRYIFKTERERSARERGGL
ncbi:MAG: flagellar brake protein [Azoarcus sp.]